MAIRFSFIQGFNQGVSSMQRLQQQVFTTQNQIATKRRIVEPADDPVGSARVVQVEQDLSQLKQYLDNAKAVESRLGLEEEQLQQVTSVLIRLRELTTQAGNGAYGQLQRQALAQEVQGRLDELVDLANTRDVNGEYIFAGFQGATLPFVQLPSGEFEYRGDDGQRQVRVAPTALIPISDSGREIFVDIDAAQNGFTVSANGNNAGTAVLTSRRVVSQPAYDANYPTDYIITFSSATTFSVTEQDGTVVLADPQPYTAGAPIVFNGAEVVISGVPVAGDSFLVDSSGKQDLFTTVANLANGLNTLTDSPADLLQLQQLIADSLTNLDNAQHNVGSVTAKIGARQNTLDSLRDTNLGIELVQKQVLSDIRDLDYTEAISRLKQESTVLEAAQQSFARISGLTLFNFLR